MFQACSAPQEFFYHPVAQQDRQAAEEIGTPGTKELSLQVQ